MFLALKMSKPRQTTLFQSWSGPKKKEPTAQPWGSEQGRIDDDDVIFCDDDEDEDLLMALELSLRESEMANNTNEPHAGPSSASLDPNTNAASTSLFSTVGNNENYRIQDQHNKNNVPNLPAEKTGNTGGKSRKPSELGLFKTIGQKQGTLRNIPEETEQKEEPSALSEAELLALEDLPGFDKFCGQKWIYPTNYPVRDYQFNIVKSALYQNTLVVLPTGLGKTFVAAVVMYNFYRWYPQGKVIFMAPTKPLVAQQIEACYNIMGIPQEATAELTGAMPPTERRKEWETRRIFFLTPQVLMNDLSRGVCPALYVKCLVVDEAHKALGNHAYVQVARELAKYEGEFRVLALSATPGSDMTAVQQVISNLLISHVELRGDDSPDIKPYTHERRVDKIVVKLGPELNAAKEKYLKLMTMVVNRLKRAGVLYNREVTSLSKFVFLTSRDAFRQNPPHNLTRQQFGIIEGDFALAMSLYHGYDLLILHGLRSLYSYLHGILNGEKGCGRTKTELQRCGDFRELMQSLESKYSPVKAIDPNMRLTQTASQLAVPFEVSHPKMEKLRDVVLEHFNKFQEKGDKTRIMIFSQYRDSVNEITELLNRHRPLVKVMSFIGQSSAGKVTKGFTQKEQLRVMGEFREGGYNTLVATCVGEEGLDIGDVDLIVCYDAHKSPIRLVQRMGRTGRKREGRIIMLVTEGKEESTYNQSQLRKRNIHKSIENGAKSLIFYANDKRMVPTGLNPQCHRMHITVLHEYKTGKRVGGTKNSTVTKPSTARRSVTKKKATSKDGFLTDEEMRQWNENYKIKETEIPKLPTTSFVTLKRTTEPETENDGRETLSLSAWMPWQNRLQDTIKVSHSAKTRIMVDLMEFIDIQGTIGDDEDVYGQEMQLYLNKADVPTRARPNISKFCQPVDGGSKRKRNEEPTAQKRIRRSEKLPGFSSDEDPLHSDDDDDDLPAFNINPAPTTNKPQNKPTRQTDTSGDDPNQDFDNDTDIGKGDNELEIFPRSPYQGKGKGKGKGCSNRTSICDVGTSGPNTTDSSDSTMTLKTKKKKRKRTFDISNHSVIKLINSNSDDDDFEGLDTKASKSNVIPVQCNVNNSPKTCDVNPEDELPDLQEQETEEAMETSPPPQVLDDVDPLSLFPSQNLPDSEPKGSDFSFQVASPPTAEEISESLETLEAKGRLSPLDVLNLIEKWEAEKEEGNVNVGAYRTCKSGKCFVPKEHNMDNQDSEYENIPEEAFDDDFFFEESGFGSQGFDQKENSLENEMAEPIATSEIRTDVRVKLKHFNELEIEIDKETSVYQEKTLKVLPSPVSPVVISDSERSTCSISPVFPATCPMTKNTSTPAPIPRVSKIPERPETLNDLSHTSIGEKTSDDMCNNDKVLEHIEKNASPIHKEAQSAKPFEDSFFANEANDSLFAAMDTPMSVPIKRRSPLLPNPTENASFMTFTQALNCVDESVLETSKSSHTKSASSGATNQTPLKNQSPQNDEQSIIKDTKTDMIQNLSKLEMPVDRPISSPDLAKSSKSQPVAAGVKPKTDGTAHFDLDFDLDEFDDEMIIPPSPPNPVREKRPSSQFSFRNKRQNSCRFNLSRSQGFHTSLKDKSNISEKTKDISKLSGKVDKPDLSKTSESVENRSGDTSPSLIGSRKFSKLSRAANRNVTSASVNMKATSNSQAASSTSDSTDVASNVKTESPKTKAVSSSSATKFTPLGSGSGQVKPPTPIAIVKPCVTNRDITEDQKNMSVTDMERIVTDPFADEEDSEDLFEPLDAEIDTEVVMDTEYVDEPPVGQEQVDSSDEDDSFILRPKRKKKIVPIICSQASPGKTSPFKTPTKPAPKVTRPSKVDYLDDDSPVLPPKKFRRQQNVLLDDDSPVRPIQPAKRPATERRAFQFTSDEDDDFTDMSVVKRKPTKTVQHGGNESRYPQHEKKKSRSAAAGFLDIEAERSEDDCSEDESEGSEMDGLDASFINDLTQLSQSQQVNEVDMRAIYRQSTRSPTLSGGRYKLAYGHNAHLDVFSQVPEQDSEYLEDSFVVHGNEEDEEADDVSSIGDDVTLLNANMNMTMSRQTRRQARQAAFKKLNAEKSTAAKRPTTKARRRVVQNMDTSSDDEVAIPSTQALMGHGPKKITSDSSNKTSSTTDQSTSEEEPVRSRLKGNTKSTNCGLRLTGIKPLPPTKPDTEQKSDQGITSVTTQIPSLMTRCHLRLNPSKPKETLPKPDPEAAKGKVTLTGKDRGSISKNTVSKPDIGKGLKKIKEDPSFNLVADFLEDDDWDERLSDMDMDNHASPELKPRTSKVKEIKTKPTTGYTTIVSPIKPGNTNDISPPNPRFSTNLSPVKPGTSIQRNPYPVSPNSSPTKAGPGLDQSTLAAKERRLRLAREKKEQFLQNVKMNTSSVGQSGGGKFHGTQIHNLPPSPAVVAERSMLNATNNLATPKHTATRAAANASFVSPIAPRQKGKLLILVDSKEINGAQDILSALRFKHETQTSVRSLGSCDYILSNRLAVERISMPAFSNGAQKARLVSRVREMCELYDRPYLIIEQERLKPGEKKPARPLPQTKYVSGIMAALARTHVKVLFSENQEQTAKLLADLAVQEQKKGQAIQASVELSSQQQQVLHFYLSLPRVSYILAVNLSHRFRTIADFMTSSESALIKRGGMNPSQAKEIHTYIKRHFDPQMLSLQR